jgi:hypothetical protein
MPQRGIAFQQGLISLLLSMLRALLLTAALAKANLSHAQDRNVTGRFEIDTVSIIKQQFLALRKCETNRIGVARAESERWNTMAAVITTLGDTSARAFFEQSLQSEVPATRFYAALGLFTLNKNGGTNAIIARLEDAQVLFQNGCVMKLVSLREAVAEAVDAI